MIIEKKYEKGIVLTGVILLVLISYNLINYNYIEGFLTASKIENPDGFRLFSEPISYLFTRLENISEMLLFYGPLLTIATYRGIKYNFQNRLIQLSLISIATLLTFFLTGVARTGETARCCLFMYPLILLPVADYINLDKFGIHEVRQIIVILYLQTIFMQIYAFYAW
jgi:hypothetical protein